MGKGKGKLKEGMVCKLFPPFLPTELEKFISSLSNKQVIWIGQNIQIKERILLVYDYHSIDFAAVSEWNTYEKQQ